MYHVTSFDVNWHRKHKSNRPFENQNISCRGSFKIMVASPLKRPVPLCEKQPDERRSKVSNRKKHCLFLNGKMSDQLAFEREPQITVFDFSLIELDYFTCRLSMNYRRDEQNFISVQEILDDYVNNSSEKENFPLQVKELGIILKEAFPRASRVQ